MAVGEVAVTPDSGDERRLDVQLAPLLSAATSRRRRASSSWTSRRYAALQTELERNKRELELAYEELQSTVEELETTNEELQSTNEELETTNEELQSTNEELETMNEELQSTNEELETINDELRERTPSSTRSTPSSRRSSRARVGVAVLDRQQRVQIWNASPRSSGGCAPTRPWAGTSSASTSACRSSARAGAARGAQRCAASARPADLEAVNRRGRTISCRPPSSRSSALDGDGARNAERSS